MDLDLMREQQRPKRPVLCYVSESILNELIEISREEKIKIPQLLRGVINDFLESRRLQNTSTPAAGADR